MKKSHESGLATHIAPESCGAARKGGVEALTGERAGRVFSRVRQLLRDADAVRRSGRPHRVHRYREVCQSPARALGQLYGISSLKMNRFAHMAVEAHDKDRAQQAFAAIGDDWDHSVWRSGQNFDNARNWARSQ
jgi:hypothetical protein